MIYDGSTIHWLFIKPSNDTVELIWIELNGLKNGIKKNKKIKLNKSIFLCLFKIHNSSQIRQTPNLEYRLESANFKLVEFFSKEPSIRDILLLLSLSSICAHQLKLCRIQKGFGTSTTSINNWVERSKAASCSVLPVGVVSEYIACCALCSWDFVFVSQRAACLIIKALSIAWYNFDNVSLQLNTAVQLCFQKAKL